MSIFKCKMCGGTIEFEHGATIGVCDSCGTKQTLPRLDDDRKANLYDRANHFRRNNDFDKAMGIYETILNDDNTDAEAYWSLVLCRYGIEYVEDPDTHKRIPTVNRAQYTSIFMDEDYKSALKYADGYQREIYEQEAKIIDEIQKGILEISRKEEPFDCFISFKETDANGRRTRDAVLAQDLYNELTKEGFKVFFAPVTLENKLGTAYEPYIFAALNSSKVMVVLGTKPENFNAVWVKNEWSRYLALIKDGAKKTLIPAYRDMDPYDLPEEFSHLMAQDMSKLGFMQDLIRGIKKLLADDEPKASVKETVVVNNGGSSVAPLLKRAFMFLEDGNWKDADEYCEKVLDQEPENALAYLGKLMAEHEVCRREQLKDCREPFDGSNNFKKALRFGDDKLGTELNGYITSINERIELNRKTEIYSRALSDMNSSSTPEEFKAAANKFASISGFKDADEKRQRCIEKIKEIKAQREKDIDEALDLAEFLSFEESESDKSLQALQQIEELKNLALQFPSIASESRDLQERKNAIEQELSDLRDARAKLGFFEGKEKKAANEKIANKEAELRTHISKMAYCQSILCGYSSIEQVNKQIEELKNTVAKRKAITEKFKNIPSYKSAWKRLIKLCKSSEVYAEVVKKSSSVKVLFFLSKEMGKPFTFGSYPYTREGQIEPIRWEVLDVQDGKILVVSKYGLDCQEFNTSETYVTWKNCTLRTWLNGTFLESAFSKKEQAAIAQTTATRATTDKVFLLSVGEANKYFSADKERECKPTDFAVGNGAYKGDNGNCWWWLRSPGENRDSAAGVSSGGSVNDYGHNVHGDGCTVRPALWINLDS